MKGLAALRGELYLYIEIGLNTPVMNVHNMTVHELLNLEIMSVQYGRDLAQAILDEQLAIHREMVGLYENKKWQELSDRHYDLRKIRIAILTLTGKLAIKQKRAAQR